jgi:hypothetical protein
MAEQRYYCSNEWIHLYGVSGTFGNGSGLSAPSQRRMINGNESHGTTFYDYGVLDSELISGLLVAYSNPKSHRADFRDIVPL